MALGWQNCKRFSKYKFTRKKINLSKSAFNRSVKDPGGGEVTISAGRLTGARCNKARILISTQPQ